MKFAWSLRVTGDSGDESRGRGVIAVAKPVWGLGLGEEKLMLEGRNVGRVQIALLLALRLKSSLSFVSSLSLFLLFVLLKSTFLY